MDLKEIGKFDQDEEKNHWWVTTRFKYIDSIIDSSKQRPLRVVEFGCGTAQNLSHLRERYGQKEIISQTLGIDINLKENQRFKWQKRNDFLTNSIEKLPDLKTYDLGLAMDVLEHIEDDLGALNKWKELLSPGATLLITVPAFQKLWSYHDEFLEHKRRYSKTDLEQLAREAGFEILGCGYIFSFLFPIAFIVRKLFRPKKENHQDLVLPPQFINTFMKLLGHWEFIFGGSNYFGTSVVAILRKPN